MGGGTSRADDMKWCSAESGRKCGSYVLDTEPQRAWKTHSGTSSPLAGVGSIPSQLIRIASDWDGDDIFLRQKNAELEEACGYSRWVRGFWPAIQITDSKKGTGRRGCLLIDIASIYSFIITRSTGCCSVKQGTVSRVPLRNISKVSKLVGDQAGISLVWKETPDFDEAGEMHWIVQAADIDALLSTLYDALSVLNYGRNVTQNIQWNTPFQGRPFPAGFFNAAEAEGCFGIQFLIYLLSKQSPNEQNFTATSDACFNLPAPWFCTRPNFETMNNPESSCAITMRSQSGAFSGSTKMLQAIKSNRLFKASQNPLRISIKDLHGPLYKETAHNITTPTHGVYDGGVLWHVHLTSGNNGTVLCNEHIALSAISAAAVNSKFHELNFTDCCFSDTAIHIRVLMAMANLCYSNTNQSSLVFPPMKTFQILAGRYGPLLQSIDSPQTPEETQNYATAWAAIGDAISRNPRPLFVSMCMADCRMGAAGFTAIMPALVRLYQQLGLSPRCLNFSGNMLPSSSVSNLCSMLTANVNGWCVNMTWLQELSLGNNPWCQAPDIAALCAVVSKATSLRILNLSSTCGVFPSSPLQVALDQSNCPLRVLVLGGAAVDPAFAKVHVDAVIGIARAKYKTLTELSMKNCRLSDNLMGYMLTHIPSIKVDFGPSENLLHIVAASPVVALDYSKIFQMPTLMIEAIPAHLMQLDLSDSTFLGHVKLLQVLNDLRAPVALSDLNIARSSFREDSVSLRSLVEVVLLNPNIMLKSLDITALGGQNIVLQCLGYCLRKNRTLTSLKCDGQGGTLDGWAALRGCFYGNKKITTFTVMWCDLTDYFAKQRELVKVNMTLAARIKPTIGQAHRAGAYVEKQSRISSMVFYKKAYKAIERDMVKATSTLNAIYIAVESNAAAAFQKSENKRTTGQDKPQFNADIENCGRKMAYHLKKLRGALNTHFDGSESWLRATADLRQGIWLFNPDAFNSFAAAVEGIDFVQSVGLINAMNSMGSIIETLLTKAAKYGYSINDYIGLIASRTDSSLFSIVELSGTSSNVIRQVAVAVKKIAPKNGGFSKIKNNRGGKNDRKRFKEKSERDNSRDDSSDIDNHSDRSRKSSKSDEEEETDDNIDIEELGGMYASCGPRDLPDGGSQGGFIDKASSGVRARQARLPYDEDCKAELAILSEVLDMATIARGTVAGILKEARGEWRKEIGNFIKQNEALCMAVREFETAMRFGFIHEERVEVPCFVATQCSVDRLPRLEAMMRAWGGCVSVAVYVPTTNEETTASTVGIIQEFTNRIKIDDTYTGSLLVSLLYGAEGSPSQWDHTYPGYASGPLYPINALRNLAVGAMMQQSSWLAPPLVFLLDVDFVPSRNLITMLQSKGIRKKCSDGEVFVVPAFENDLSIGSRRAVDYTSKKDVLRGMNEGHVSPFHVSYFPRGHSPSDYDRWKKLSISDANYYRVQYQEFYEPYIVMETSRFIPYDERFRGYGLNKCIHLRALSRFQHVQFNVLKDHFVIADTHCRSDAHKNTYGPDSGFRKYVVYETYSKCIAEMGSGTISPKVSMQTAEILKPLMRKEHQYVKGWSEKVKDFATVIPDDLNLSLILATDRMQTM